MVPERFDRRKPPGATAGTMASLTDCPDNEDSINHTGDDRWTTDAAEWLSLLDNRETPLEEFESFAPRKLLARLVHRSR